ncbi:hypothetical protein [Microbacterium resistens]|uniref:Uncharacterized protein n=2 Tax=Microbacterium resistens TaxID=156977 RepID=A0ABY3RQR1_9MICO|nr:hypothetical protein [Microbacterium resistens]UGS25585.1 hypothetical protein K8F61_12980 [Microbacterium resistens]
MVDREPRYVSRSEGAPPVPPPGGYRGARRLTTPGSLPPGAPVPAGAADAVAGAGSPGPAPVEDRAPRTGPLGWVALGAAVLFAVVLLALLAAGAVDAFYGTTMLVLQLLVLGVVIAGLTVRRGRLLSAIGLAVVLLFNLGTVGGLGAVSADAGGGYEGRKTEEQKLWEAYPGIKDVDPRATLAQPSLEEVRAQAEQTLTRVRERLSAEFGFTWVPVGDETLRPERNGYGGESMLVQYTSASWATTEPVTGYPTKLEVMRTVEDELIRSGFSSMLAFNDPASGVDPGVIRKMYGGDTPQDQVLWEWYASTYPEPTLFYADITDLANDVSGDYRASREATSARTGEPLEGLSLTVVAREVLSADDVEAFEQALKNYP